MHYLTLFAMIAVTTMSYLVSLKVAPQAIKFLPELISVAVTVYVVFAGMTSRFKYLRSHYLLFFGAVTIVIVCGIIANAVAPGPIISGMRYYFRAIPFFFLPIVYPFRETQIKQQLLLLMGISLLQLPLAVYQRYSLLQEGRVTGDYVFGTLMLSPTLTIFLVIGICVLLALLIKKRLSKLQFVVLFFLFLIPTTINETKITLFYLPTGILTTVLMATPKGQRFRMLGLATVVIILFAAVFIPVYDYIGRQSITSESEAISATDMFTQENYFEKYLDRGNTVGDTKEVGRVDATAVPFAVITGDPVWFAFGLGVGNAAISSLGTQFSGEHSALLGRYASGGSSVGAFLLEIGILGFACVLGLHWLIFKDSVKIARTSNDLISALATAWPAAILIFTLSFFYSSIVPMESLSYLFWYFSGLIAARRMQLATRNASTVSEQRSGHALVYPK